ncbi:Peptidase S41 family protein ustP [Erysiphe neolycopersici]|uniref:Peptidase S41 family protein ustP n=1 Tax=Erysiphe neolycopersici TaxID=212602 RepID=A0A420HV94_9PEZI|nr:Peptidase S41 family protein ustP [Erysiphe neolycopersici]
MRFDYLCASLAVVIINPAWATFNFHSLFEESQPTKTNDPSKQHLSPVINLSKIVKPVANNISFLSKTQKEPCAVVSSSSAVQILANPTAIPIVPAKLAYDCLTSVPLNKTAALELVYSIEPYIQWQSNLAWLKDPPKDYDFPPHDTLNVLASVKENLLNDKYPNEHSFQIDLYSVFTLAHDGHFIFFPDLLSRALDFRRQRALVSISEDGKSLPVIKLFGGFFDLPKSSLLMTCSKTNNMFIDDVIRAPRVASEITQINGINASEFIVDEVIKTTGQQIIDAGYNTLFYSKAGFAINQGSGFFAGAGRGRFLYPGPNTTLTFGNGTSLSFQNVASIRGNFTGVDSGQAFYQRFCDPNRFLVPSPAPPPPVSVPPSPLVPGYPPAVIKTNNTAVSGYYLDGDGFEDVAVLSLLTFESPSPPEYQRVVEKFFSLAKRDGKKKLLIDLSQNGGGLIFLGYDIFRQLFPDIVQDGNSRWRVNDNFKSISEIFSSLAQDFNPDTTSSRTLVTQANLPFNFREDLKISNQSFKTFGDKFGPFSVKDDKFTNLMRWNLSDPILTRNSTFGIGTDVTGYGFRQNFTRPFAPEDIVMLHDGYCASTCTIFSQFMRELGGVKSIAMGGRPISGPIEGVGGVKGSQILLWNDIYQLGQSALLNATEEQAKDLRRLTTLPLSRSGAAASNVRDAILAKNIDDGTPSQFIREISDCRLYYTEHMITDVTALWKTAADSAFNGKACAYGSLPKRPAGSALDSVSQGFMIESTEFITYEEISPEQNAAWLAVHEQKAIN